MSSSTQLGAESVKVVFIPRPVDGDTETLPPEGMPPVVTATSAKATWPLNVSEAVRRNT